MAGKKLQSSPSLSLLDLFKLWAVENIGSARITIHGDGKILIAVGMTIYHRAMTEKDAIDWFKAVLAIVDRDNELAPKPVSEE